MVKVNGKNIRMYKTVINMRDSTKMTRKMVMVSSCGKVGIFTKVIMQMMKDMVMEK